MDAVTGLINHSLWRSRSRIHPVSLPARTACGSNWNDDERYEKIHFSQTLLFDFCWLE